MINNTNSIIRKRYNISLMWFRYFWPDILGVSVVLLIIISIIICHIPDKTPIVVRNDMGLILDVDQAPENRGYNIRTDQVFARTNLRSYEIYSLPVGSRLYYIVQASGRKGWMIDKPLP